MTKTKKILVQKHIIKRFMTKEFKEIPKHKIIDIIPTIVARWPRDIAILASWEKHFREQKAPYVITETKVDHATYGKTEIRTLWKEEIAEKRP